MTRRPALPASAENRQPASGEPTDSAPRRLRRRLPIRSRASGMAVAALGLSIVAALAMPLAQRISPAHATPVADAGAFEVWFGGLPLGSVAFTISVTPERYFARAVAEPARAIKSLFGAKLEAEGEGEADPVLPRPTRFSVATAFAGDHQRVEVAYSPPGRPSAVQAEPGWKPREWEIDPTAQTGTTDPVGAAALFLAPASPASLCDASVEVFDGRRRSRIELDRPAPRPGAEGEGWRCEGRWSRVAGFRPRDLDKAPIPVAIDFARGADGLARVVRLQADTGYGLAVATRVPMPVVAN